MILSVSAAACRGVGNGTDLLSCEVARASSARDPESAANGGGGPTGGKGVDCQGIYLNKVLAEMQINLANPKFAMSYFNLGDGSCYTKSSCV